MGGAGKNDTTGGHLPAGAKGLSLIARVPARGSSNSRPPIGWLRPLLY